jgi:hypothetical protein
MIEIACSTHALLVDSALFAGPVVMCGAALWVATRRDRQRDEAEAAPGDAATAPAVRA